MKKLLTAIIFLTSCFFACAQDIYLGYSAEYIIKEYEDCTVNQNDSLFLHLTCPSGGFSFNFDIETLLCISSGMSFGKDLLSDFLTLIEGKGYHHMGAIEVNKDGIKYKDNFCKEGFSCVLLEFEDSKYLAMFKKYDDCQ